MGHSPDDKPLLRWPLEIEPFHHEGEALIVIRDSVGVSPHPTVFPEAVAPLLARFDGNRTLESIAEEGAPYGVTLQLVQELADQLDLKLLLENDNSRARHQEIRDEFAKSRVRPSSHAGAVYASEPEELKRQLDKYIDDSQNGHLKKAPSDEVIAMIAPHIDYHRGWHAYGTAFSILQQTEKPDVIYLLGTSHQPGKSIFQLTDKDFATPLGTLPTEREVVADLAKRYGEQRAFQDELLHLKEHSLELQLPFIAHRYGGAEAPKLVPILVGSFYHCLGEGKAPYEYAEISDFIDALAESISEQRKQGRKVLLFGGVDLAHVGQHFGDTEHISSTGLEEIEQRDKELLDTVINCDEQKLFEHIAEDLDKRRICGFPTIYSMLLSMKRSGINLSGDLVEYRQAVNPENDCIVTFASACWYER